jgi:hypothetical protein
MISFVANRIHLSVDVDYIIVIKATKHVDDGVCAADISRGTGFLNLHPCWPLDESGDVYNFNCRGTTRLGFTSFSRTISRSSGTVITPTLGSMVQKWKVSCLGFCIAQCVEES